MHNKDIARQFNKLSKYYDILGEERKAKSWSAMAFQIERMNESLREMSVEDYQNVRGIGKAGAQAIAEIVEEKWNLLEETIELLPIGIQQLSIIRGIGAKKIGRLWRELNINSPDELKAACEANELIALKGFAKKTQENILKKVNYFLTCKGQWLWANAEVARNELEKFLNAEWPDIQIQAVGDFALQKEVVSELVLLVDKNIKEKLKEHSSCYLENDQWYYQGKKVSIIECASHEFEDLVLKNTYATDLLAKANSQKAIALKLPFYLRDNSEALDKHLAGERLGEIQEADIKGIVHNHSVWSDGVNTIKEMAEACMERNMEYLVMSDHSKTSFYAGGLSEMDILAQQEEIDALNEELAPFRIFKSIECDILGDGSLDYDEDVLESFDLVICSIHQNLDMTEDKAMMRLLTAVEHPFCSMICHPTGRLLLNRQAYPVDHKLLIDTCVVNDVVLEINANPNRLDMDSEWFAYALERGALFSINPDAHAIEQIDYTRYGVRTAQRAMLPASRNLSSFTLSEFEEFLVEQHAKRGV